MPLLLAQQIPDHRVAAVVDSVFRGQVFQRLTLGQAIWQWFVSLVLRIFGLVISWYQQLRASPVLFWTLLVVVAALVLAIVGRAV